MSAQHDDSVFIASQYEEDQTGPPHLERQAAENASPAASQTTHVVETKCSVNDFLQAALVLNLSRANVSHSKLNVVVESSIGKLLVEDSRLFMLLNRMVAYVVDNRTASNISISAELSEVTAIGFHVKFLIAAKPITGLSSSLHAANQPPYKSVGGDPGVSASLKLRDVMTMAIMLQTQIRTDLMSHARPKLSFCVGARMADELKHGISGAPLTMETSMQKKHSILLVTCLSDSTSRLIQSLDGPYCSVSTLKDSLHALRTASASQFDLIFLDMRPGPIRCEALFKQLRTSKRHQSQDAAIYAYGPSSEDGRKKPLHLSAILKSLAIDSNQNDPRFSQSMFQVVSKSTRGPTLELQERTIAPFEFVHARLDELVRTMGYGRFLRSALAFADELSVALELLADSHSKTVLPNLTLIIRNLADTASHFGANSISDLCGELELAMTASDEVLKLKIGTRLAAAGLRAQLQLRNFSALVCGVPDFEHAASAARF